MDTTQYKDITTWQDATFPHVTTLSCVNHLEEEVNELKVDIQNGQATSSEIADCFLLLYAICHKSGMEYDDIVRVIEDKMTINRQRKWGEINEKGYVKHRE